MSEHSIFYYPYADFKNEQLPLLKVAALYFDKLYILNPHKASHAPNSVTLEIDGTVERDLQWLEKQSILEYVSPAEVLGKYEKAIAQAVRADMEDEAFQSLCRVSGQAARWELALEKVPKELQQDQAMLQQDEAMHRLMGELPREVADPETWFLEEDTPYPFRRGGYPLAFGESIMINHALFASFGLKGATPLTDDEFHDEVLAFKIGRPRKNSEIRQMVRRRMRNYDFVAFSALSNIKLNLPALSPEVTLQEILDYRVKHPDELKQARKLLGEISRHIREQPWTPEFADELEENAIPQLNQALEEVKKTRDNWLLDRSKKTVFGPVLGGVGGAAGIAAGIIGLVLLPTPFSLVAAIGGIASLISATASASQFGLDWSDTRDRIATENGLRYLLMGIKKESNR